jgi:hypothetical protein
MGRSEFTADIEGDGDWFSALFPEILARTGLRIASKKLKRELGVSLKFWFC